MDNAYIQVLADGTGIVVTHDFDMGVGDEPLYWRIY